MSLVNMPWVGSNLIWFKKDLCGLKVKQTGEMLFSASQHDQVIWVATAWLNECDG